MEEFLSEKCTPWESESIGERWMMKFRQGVRKLPREIGKTPKSLIM
jgi:hypothetical protein